MFEDLSLKISLFLFPLALFIAGARLTQTDDWFWGGVLSIVLGVWIALYIAIIGIIREQGRTIREKTDYYEAMDRFYERLERMTEENKFAFGITHAPSEILVKVDRTKEVGNDFSQIWQKLPVAPYKLKVIAQAALAGERFTFRKWSGKGKLLAPAEWEALKNKMLEMELIEQAHDEVAQQGFNWTGLGIDVMEQCVKDGIGEPNE